MSDPKPDPKKSLEQEWWEMCERSYAPLLRHQSRQNRNVIFALILFTVVWCAGIVWLEVTAERIDANNQRLIKRSRNSWAPGEITDPGNPAGAPGSPASARLGGGGESP
jgi:hypothetical protein